MKTNINIGIIGTGVGIRTHLPSFRANGANIIGLVGRDYLKTKDLALEHGINRAYKDYKELCDDPNIDLVVIATPNDLHFEQVKYAIEKNKHILAEKPLVLTVAENEELIRLASSKKKLFLVNHQLRFNPYMRKIKSIIRDGDLGHIYYVNIHQQSSAFTKKELSGWSFYSKNGGGVRLAMGSHLVDLILFLFPKRSVNSVFGGMDNVIALRKNEAYRKETDVSSFVCASLNMEGNLNVHLTSTAAMSDSKFEITIYGSDGELKFNLIDKLKMFTIGDDSEKSIFVEGVLDEERLNEVSIFEALLSIILKSVLESLNVNSFIPEASGFHDALNELRILEKIKVSANPVREVGLEVNSSVCNCVT